MIYLVKLYKNITDLIIFEVKNYIELLEHQTKNLMNEFIEILYEKVNF